MAQVQEEAIKVVSAAIANGEGDLLACAEAAEEKWQEELNETKATARTLLATVLAERESLRQSLGTAAKLWKTLRPKEVVRNNPFKSKGTQNSPQDPCFLANEEHMANVKALQNVSHTLFLTEFITSAPEALERAQSFLSKIQEDGLENVVVGNAALLVESHAILTAVERLRDLVLLQSSQNSQLDDSSPSVWFSSATETRLLLEDIVLEGIFSSVVEISQQNPRILVAAARVVESEELEDIWWDRHVQKSGQLERGAAVRSFGSQGYRKRALDTIVGSLQCRFHEKEKALGLHNDSSSDVITSNSQDVLRPPIDVTNVLDWIEHRRSENETVRRFVVPCLPPSFAVSDIYEKELHRQFMRLITGLLHLVQRDGSMLLSEEDLIQLTSWYSNYKEEVGDQDEPIDSFLSDEDRKRLICALQKHCSARISAKIADALAADSERDISFRDHRLGLPEDNVTSHREAEFVVRHTDLPDIVLGCVNEQVRRMLVLNICGLDQAIAQTVAECLTKFQIQVRERMEEEEQKGEEDNCRLYACATANNMARCLEHSEDLRDVFIPLALDHDRSDIEDKMEQVIEGFRSTAAVALKVLIKGMSSSLQSHAVRLYAPHTGTEIMLDIIATLEDYFSDYERYLLPYHFEHLVIESLKRVVVWYIAPFLRLAQCKPDDCAARRFSSLPTHDEMNDISTHARLSKADVELFSRRKEKGMKGDGGTDGLGCLNGAAVVAQIDKDIANLTSFMEKKVVLYQKKQLSPTFEPLNAIRSLYTCNSTTFGLSDAYREAKRTISRALHPSWVAEYNIEEQFSARIAELMWESRKDVNPIVLLEVINIIQTSADKMESTSPSRMSSFDDGRMWGSRNSDLGGPFSERLLKKDASNYDQTGSSSSLLWAPSLSRSSRKK